MAKIRLCPYFFAALRVRVHSVREHRTTVPGPLALNPRDDKLRFAQRQTIVIDEMAVTRKCRPGRHVASNRLGADLPRPNPCLFPGLERKRRAILDVTHYAVFVQDPYNLTVEQNRGRERLM